MTNLIECPPGGAAGCRYDAASAGIEGGAQSASGDSAAPTARQEKHQRTTGTRGTATEQPDRTE